MCDNNVFTKVKHTLITQYQTIKTSLSEFDIAKIKPILKPYNSCHKHLYHLSRITKFHSDMMRDTFRSYNKKRG